MTNPLYNPPPGLAYKGQKLVVSQYWPFYLASSSGNSVFLFQAPFNLAYPVNFLGSVASLQIAPAANWSAKIYVNSTQIGTATNSAGQQGTLFSVSSAGTLADGNILSFVSQSNDGAGGFFTASLIFTQSDHL